MIALKCTIEVTISLRFACLCLGETRLRMFRIGEASHRADLIGERQRRPLDGVGLGQPACLDGLGFVGTAKRRRPFGHLRAIGYLKDQEFDPPPLLGCKRTSVGPAIDEHMAWSPDHWPIQKE